MTTVTDDTPLEVSNHRAYPGHKLKRVASEDGEFNCHGCLRSGTGTRYRLEYGDRSYVDLHTCCAVEPIKDPSLTHPTLGYLEFKTQPPERTDGNGRFCGRCGEAVNLFVYHNAGTGVSYHPCCAFEWWCMCTKATAKPRKPGSSKLRNP